MGENQGQPTTTINDLPDDVLGKIISFISIYDALKCSIVCKRWKPFSYLIFDEELMQEHSSKPHKYGSLVGSLLRSHYGDDLRSCRFKHLTHDNGVVGRLVKFVVQKYKRLSCLALECVYQNSYLLVKDGIFSNICSLELTNYSLMNNSASSAFDGCEKLKILKMKKILMSDKILKVILKRCSSLEKFSLIGDFTDPDLSRNLWLILTKLNIQKPSLKYLEIQSLELQEIYVYVENLEVLVLNNIICPPKMLEVHALNLKAFYSSCNSSDEGIMRAHDIIENCTYLERNRTNIFKYLSTLSIELDLNNGGESGALSFVLSSCLCLKTLEITIPTIPVKSKEYSNYSGHPSNYPTLYEEIMLQTSRFKSMSWDKSRKKYPCVIHQLEFATIKGFSGKEQEVKFVKHLITTAYYMKRISIICNSSKVAEAEEIYGMLYLSLPRASAFLSQVRKQELTWTLF